MDLKFRANLEATASVERQTPLVWAVCHGAARMVHFLIKNNASWKFRDIRNANLFHYAIKYNKKVIAHYLLQLDPTFLDARDKDGHTPLMLGAYEVN